jgi:2-haloacid dehalogenase/putative hydrolase of the HAD superfamily
MNRETVVFDLGGVVFNWQPLRLIREVFPAHAIDDTSAARLFADLFQSHNPEGDWAQWDMGLIEPQELALRIAARSGMSQQEIIGFIAALAPHMHVKADTVALIHELKAAGHRLVYLSNMPEELAQRIERDHPFADWFEDGVFSARVKQVKPQVQIYRCAQDRLRLDGQAPIFIDDMIFNIQAAKQLGWRTIQFSQALQTRSLLVEMGLLN